MVSNIVTLYKSNFDISKPYTVHFENAAAREEQFKTLNSMIIDPVTWVREEQAFRAPGNINEINQYNYLSFTNIDDNAGTQTFYAYITGTSYINQNMTYVTFAVDSFMTYQFDIDILPSPIIRQHPKDDTAFQNVVPEPINVNKWCISRAEIGKVGEDDNIINLVTANNSDSFADRTTSFFQSLAYFITGSSTALNNFFDTLEVTPCSCGTITQGTTSVVTRVTALDILGQYAKVGRDTDIIAAYHIPKTFRYDVTGQNLASLETQTGTIELPITYVLKPLWNKIKILPQFNQIIVSVAGNSRNYDYNLFTESVVKNESISFKYSANQGIHGQIVVTPQSYAGDSATPGEYSVASQPWDTIQLTTSQVNESQLFDKMVTSVVSGVSAAFSGLSGNMAGALTGAAKATAEGLQAEGEAGTASVVEVGANNSTMSTYNEIDSLVSISHYSPDNTSLYHINLFFNEFGYSYDNMTDYVYVDSMPIFNYVHTNGVNVRCKEGSYVPIEYMNNLKQIFDTGIYIFNGLSNYGHTDYISSNHF